MNFIKIYISEKVNNVFQVTVCVIFSDEGFAIGVYTYRCLY